MKTLLISALALGVLTTTALSDPIVLADNQLDAVAAGGQHFVLTPGLPEGSFHTSEGVVGAGTVVFPELKDASGFNVVQTPGQPGLFVEHDGQVQRSTIVDESALPQ